MPVQRRQPIFFESPARFRAWLRRHHGSERELWVGFHKRNSGRPSLTWPQSVDEALCFGWIDGVRKSVDASRYMIRFTPRKPGSNWSTVNTRHATELIEAGRMQPAGLKAFEARDPEKSAAYSFEQRKTAALSPQEKTRFRRSPRAWAFFESQPPGYRRIVIWWVVSAKRQETRARRLGTLIEDSSNGRRIGLLRRNEP